MSKRKSASTGSGGGQEISIRYIPLDEVETWPRNPKQHDFPTLFDSLRRFGFTSPLIPDDETGRLVAGHGRLEALIRMRDAGAERPARIGVDARGVWTVPVLGGVAFESEQEAEAYLLADNRISELGGWNQDELDAMLSDLDDLAGIGFELPEPEDIDLPDPEPEPEPRRRTPAREVEPPTPTPSPRSTPGVGRILGNIEAPLPPAPVVGPPRPAPTAAQAPVPVPWSTVVQPGAPAPDTSAPEPAPPVLPDPVRPTAATGMGPTVIIQYNVIFDTAAQRDRFLGLLKWLKAQYPTAETVAERLDLWLQTVRPSV